MAAGFGAIESKQVVMSLAAILGMLAVLGSPARGSVPWAQVLNALQSQPGQQDAPPAAPQAAPRPAEQQPESPSTQQTPNPNAGAKSGSPQADSTTTPPAAKPAARASKPSAGIKHKQHPAKKPPLPNGGGPAKVIVRNGSTVDPTIQLAPSVTQEQASHQKQNTTQLLATTDGNLKKISVRQLNPSQQDTVNQIRTYMSQAKTAADAGDLTRAHNLAFKAHLLSDDLVKH
jgi:hypothetical protein